VGPRAVLCVEVWGGGVVNIIKQLKGNGLNFVNL
jgi:hypothetical protein